VVSSIGQYKSLKMNQQDLNNILAFQSKKFTKSENILFLSVIYQALLDATVPKSSEETTSITSIRRQATNWFFASIGVTSQNFEFVCDYAGLTPSSVREFASYVINSDGEHEARDKLNRIWKGTKDE
jgi:hypothetical protein